MPKFGGAGGSGGVTMSPATGSEIVGLLDPTALADAADVIASPPAGWAITNGGALASAASSGGVLTVVTETAATQWGSGTYTSGWVSVQKAGSIVGGEFVALIKVQDAGANFELGGIMLWREGTPAQYAQLVIGYNSGIKLIAYWNSTNNDVSAASLSSDDIAVDGVWLRLRVVGRSVYFSYAKAATYPTRPTEAQWTETHSVNDLFSVGIEGVEYNAGVGAAYNTHTGDFTIIASGIDASSAFAGPLRTA